jgi:transposase
MLTYGVMSLHDNVRPDTAARTLALLEHFNWGLFDYPPYRPDLAPSYHHLFTYLKNWLGSERFNINDLTESVKTWLRSQATDFSNTRIQKITPRYKRLNSGGEYFEK